MGLSVGHLLFTVSTEVQPRQVEVSDTRTGYGPSPNVGNSVVRGKIVCIFMGGGGPGSTDTPRRRMERRRLVPYPPWVAPGGGVRDDHG